MVYAVTLIHAFSWEIKAALRTIDWFVFVRMQFNSTFNGKVQPETNMFRLNFFVTCGVHMFVWSFLLVRSLTSQGVVASAVTTAFNGRKSL